MTLKWCFIVLFSSFIQSSIQVPSVDFKLEPNGFRLSLKDETGIRRVSFQVNRNREFKTFSQGEFYGTVTEKTYNQWSYKFDQVLKPSDVLHIWTNVQYGGTNYRLFSEPILVSNYKESTDTQSATRPPTRPPTGPATRPPTRPPTNPPTTPTITEPESCDPSITEINDRGKRVCKDELIFEENFDTYDSGTWQNLVRLPLEESDNEFVLYDTKPKIENGFAIFKPILKADYPLSKANGFRLEGCTYELDSEKECQITRNTWNSMPPVVVPRIQTKKSFNFKYGKVEIRAKMPKGDWLVPLLLLEPVVKHYGAEFNEHGQLRVAYIRGNVNSGDEIDGSHLYGGPIVSTLPEDRDQFLVSTKRNSHFGDDFHVYTLIWTNTKISLYVDDLLYGERTGPFPTKRKPHNNSIQPFDKMFYLSLGVIAGGFGDFPDNIEKPWENTSPKAKALFEKAKEDWLRTWTSPELTVDYVRVYAV